MAQTTTERVLEVKHWNDTLFTIKTTRSPTFRFESGQFVMMGLEVPEQPRPVLRAYSVASAHYDEYLEFFSIKVQDGALTSRLQHVKVDDSILVGNRATGTLTLSNLLPGRTLWLLSTGTGLAPFLSIVKDPDAYERFDRIVLVHSVRYREDLAYKEYLETEVCSHEAVGDDARTKLRYYPTVTREAFVNNGRITQLIESGKLFEDNQCGPFSKETDRIMICGNTEMLEQLTNYFEGIGFSHGNSGERGHFLTERAFAPAR